MLQTKTLKELADHLGGRVIGDEAITVNGLAPLEAAGPDKVTFLANPRYAAKVAETSAGAVLMAPGGEGYGRNVIEVSNPYLAFAKLLTLFYVQPRPARGVLPEACLGTDVSLGDDITIHPGVIIGDHVTIGDRCVLYPGAVVYDGATIGDDTVIHAHAVIRERCRIGRRCVIQPGAVIGSDGFGYAPDGEGYYKIPQLGIVVIEDDVEIGANTVIDRAALTATVIGRGTKIDNLVQIAHNCVIGQNCTIVSQVGISGSTKLGNRVTLAGQVGVAGHLTIGDNVMVGAKSGIPGNIPSGSLVSGIPAFAHREWLRSMAVVPKLPDMKKTVAALEKRVKELEEKLAAG